ncbi:MAG TPA: ABC transporter substrate-binding protein [Glutamicibacter sp.]|uniref:Cyclohexadienyl dehydratase n=1 Tax=Glutamicibacter arilaitensis (strain DSM 16368 / CIP 108037 / IAM 15318 / JCM 13566 / NCIMB 14258 / Re117) TaxID=861360 RepID=A0ABP1U5U3_GLUAR|nr:MULTISPECIES: transporter substrate-binding domain-containing protein [Glutamicibacter]CBT77355.1 cyclohexadienyl dehydratase [Glutamicibacter arilaitensis Re117]HCH48835.1 ABC transporter substrate-binding protein [Glutamicibacter sp.]
MTDSSQKNPSITRRLPLLVLCAALFLSSCSAPAPESGDVQKPVSDSTRLDSVVETGTLKVCTTGDYRPFTYLDPDSGEWSGIDITMAKNLAETMGVEPEFIQTSWKDLMPDFLSKCDMAVGGVSISMERAQQAYYSEATLDEGKTPITLCENVEKYDTIKEINQPGVRSITPIGGTNEKFADANYPDGEIIRFEDNNKIFDEIIAGRADVMTTDASETRWVANEHPELCAVHPDKPFNFSQKAYLLPLGDDEFQEYVNQWLNMAKNDGTLAAAEKPWFG